MKDNTIVTNGFENNYFLFLVSSETNNASFEQNRRIDHTEKREQLKTPYKTHLRQILTSKLHNKSTFKAINAYPVPILTFIHMA